MLKEIIDPRQNTDETRRIFSDEFFDLYVWYDMNNEFIGFQLCYNKQKNEHCLNWKRNCTAATPEVFSGEINGRINENGEFSHYKVDSGDEPEAGHFKMKPVLQPDGIFNKKKIMAEFEQSSINLEIKLKEFILNKLNAVDL